MINNLERIIDNLKVRHPNKIAQIRVPETHKCQMCGFILNNPYQTLCGCLYCKTCIDSRLNESDHCPGKTDGCKDMSLKSITEDKARAKEVSRLKVKCLFDDCTEKIELNLMGEHLDKCVYRAVECDLCHDVVVERRMEVHRVWECKERQVRCANCGLSMHWSLFNSEHNSVTHDKVCPNYVGQCPYDCGVLEKVVITQHRKTCTKKIVQCPLWLLGCRVGNLTVEQLKDHLREEILGHYEIMVRCLSDRDARIKGLNLLLEELNKEIEGLRGSVAEAEGSIESCIKHSAGGFMVGPDPEEVIWRSGQLLWKVENYMDLREKARLGHEVYVLSEPFYSKDFGYKMCLKLYPNGDGAGQGTHLSLFFGIMRGDFDNILPWPFSHRIKLSIISGADPSIRHSEMFKPEIKSECYAKPRTMYNVGSGSPMFLHQESLTKIYIKEGCFFIKATILSE